MVGFGQIAANLIEVFEPVVEGIVEIVPFPFNNALAFIWGGIKEIILEVIFG